MCVSLLLQYSTILPPFLIETNNPILISKVIGSENIRLDLIDYNLINIMDWERCEWWYCICMVVLFHAVTKL